MAYVVKKARRMKGTVVKPFIYGSVAFWLGKQAADERSHRWTVYVRGLNGEEDLSYFIKKVEFQLHSSFTNSLRSVEQAPFEVTEYGWGEFSIGIRVYFQDLRESPVLLQHGLKLFSELGQATKKPVIAERYDEFVFVEPVESFYQKLQTPPEQIKRNEHPLAEHFRPDVFIDRMRRQEKALEEAELVVSRAMGAYCKRLHAVEKDIENLQQLQQQHLGTAAGSGVGGIAAAGAGPAAQQPSPQQQQLQAQGSPQQAQQQQQEQQQQQVEYLQEQQ